jgi:hypothetical protein
MDYIIATDVVYNESVVPKLVRTLKNLCEIREHVRGEYDQVMVATWGVFRGFRLKAILEEKKKRRGGGTKGQAPTQGMKRTLGKAVLVAQDLRTDYVHLAFLEGWVQMMDHDYQSGYVIYACSLAINPS